MYTRGTYFQKKYLGTQPSESHILLGFDHQFFYSYGYFKHYKIAFFKIDHYGGTPSVLLTSLKNCDLIDLKIELLAINMNMMNNFCFFFGPVSNKWFHSNLLV